MTGSQIVRQGSVGFTDHGDSVYSTASYVKVAVSFKSGSLRLLQGAPLSVFICLALHEADSDPGASLTTIEGETGYSNPSAIKAIRFLRAPEHHFIDEIGTDDDGSKHYRVAAYAWVGNSRQKESGSPPTSTAPFPKDVEGGKETLPGKVFSPVVVSSCSSTCSKDRQQQQLFARARELLRAAGIADPALTVLATSIAPERAEMWADWLSDPPASFTHPAAFAIKRLRADALADPPGWTLPLWQQWREEDAAAPPANASADAVREQDVAAPPANDGADAEREEAAASSVNTGADAANAEIAEQARLQEPRLPEPPTVAAASPDLPAPSAGGVESAIDLDAVEVWDIALKELQGQMTRATFDLLLRPTRALGFDGDQLVVRVATSYAKEWLEQRLAVTVQRTVTGVAGRAISVRYEAKP